MSITLGPTLPVAIMVILFAVWVTSLVFVGYLLNKTMRYGTLTKSAEFFVYIFVLTEVIGYLFATIALSEWEKFLW